MTKPTATTEERAVKALERAAQAQERMAAAAEMITKLLGEVTFVDLLATRPTPEISPSFCRPID